jgi:enamine deaminase RidA (YjgF/YER057c/UK114 family)
MSNIAYRNPDELAAPIGAYSHVARSSSIVTIAGQLGLDANGELVGPGDIEAQVTQAYRNVRTALQSEGLDFPNVLQTMTFLVNPDDVAGFYRARQAFLFDEVGLRHAPPNTLLVVQQLVKKEFLFEVQAVALLQ